MAIFPGAAASRRKVIAARLHLLEQPKVPLPFKPAETTRQHSQHEAAASPCDCPVASCPTGGPLLHATCILAQNSRDYQPGPSSAPGLVPWCGPHLNVPSGQRPAAPSTHSLGSDSPTWAPGPAAALSREHSAPSQRCPLIMPGDACFQCHGVGACVATPP